MLPRISQRSNSTVCRSFATDGTSVGLGIFTARLRLSRSRNSPRTRRISWALGVALTSAAAMLMAISAVWYVHRPELSVVDGNAAPARFTSGSRFPQFAFPIAPFFGQKPVAPPAPAAKITIADVLLESPRLPSRLHGYCGALDELAFAEHLDEFEQFAPAIRPLRASLAVIWDTLCRTIPTTTRSDTSP